MKFLKKLWLPLTALVMLGTSCRGVKVDENLRIHGTEFRESEDKKKLWLLPEHKNVPCIELTADSYTARVAGIAVIMPDFPIRDENGVWKFEGFSAEAVLRPLLERSHYEIRRVLIDPGHGGSDSGALSVLGDKEKDLNLLLSLEIAAELRKYDGIEVFVTRNRDRTIPLDKRGILTERCNADLFISVHHNCAANPHASGFETFVLRPENAAEAAACGRSVLMAHRVQLEQIGVTGSVGRGVKFARFRVLRDAGCPAILIESGFLSNRQEAAKCRDPEYRKQIARAVAKAVQCIREPFNPTSNDSGTRNPPAP